MVRPSGNTHEDRNIIILLHIYEAYGSNISCTAIIIMLYIISILNFRALINISEYIIHHENSLKIEHKFIMLFVLR